MADALRGNARKPLFPRGAGPGLRALLLILASLLLILADHRTSTLNPLRATIASGLQPLLWVARAPQNIAALAGYIAGHGELSEQNRLLREQALEMQARLLRVASLEAENRRLRELLASGAQLNEQVLVAEIVATNQDPYRHQIVVNRGTRDGVYRGQALVDAYGVLGQVVRVLPNTAVALLITDPDHGIPVEVNRTGLQTIALGRGDGLGLSLPFLPGNADVKVGDLLVSSSLGGRFPAGYPVGQVAELRYQPGEHFMEAIAYPAARINRGRQVLLVWSESFPVDENGEVMPLDESAEPDAVPKP